MKAHQIESWALSVIERVESGQPIEDSRVELKAQWPDPQKAARRIVGHANAARGEPILWLIGVDEKKGIVGANNTDMASWYSAVREQFDGLAPQVVDLNIPVKDSTIVALLFETDRSPFVVKNPVHGSKDAGPVSLETPWREGTAIRSATRSDLLRLLSPLQKLPSFEVLSCSLTASLTQTEGSNVEQRLSWWIQIKLYVVPRTESRIVIPIHRCEASFEVAGCLGRTPLPKIYLHPPRSFMPRGGSRLQSLTIDGTANEVVIDGPGMLYLDASATMSVIAKSFPKAAQVAANLFSADAERSAPIIANLFYSTPSANEIAKWTLKNPSSNELDF